MPYVLLITAVILFLSSFLFNTNYSENSPVSFESKKLETYIQKRQDEVDKLTSNITLIKNLVVKKESKEEFNTVLNNKFSYFLYRKSIRAGNEMIFWSNQETTPPVELSSLPDGEYFRKLANGSYICIKKTIANPAFTDTIISYALIPVQYEYFLETKFLPDNFAFSKSAAGKISIATTTTDYPVKSLSGKILFYVTPKYYSPVNEPGGLGTWLRIISVIFLLIFIHFLSEFYIREKGAGKGVVLLILLLVVIRTISYFIDFPVNLRQFDLFDPKVYGSNSVQKSLGDLLINAGLLCWISLFTWSTLKNIKYEFNFKVNRYGSLISVLLTIIIVAFTFVTAKIIRSLAADSNISFDVINFFSLNKFSVFGFVVLSLLAIGYYYFVKIIITFISFLKGFNFSRVFLIIPIAGLSYLTIRINHPLLQFYIFVLIWLIIYIYISRTQLFSVAGAKLNIASTLFWIFLFSVSISAIIITANREKEWEIRKKVADKIDVQSDPYNERQLSIAFTYIDDDFLTTNFIRFTNKDSCLSLKDSILKEGGYLNKYSSRFYVFDATGKGLYNEDAESLNTLNTIVAGQAKPTNTPHLFYYETAYDKFTFIFKRDVKEINGIHLGTVFIVSNPEQYSKDALYPELFRKSNESSPEESPAYSYAIYKKSILMPNSFNKYSFATSISGKEIPLGQYEKRINDNYIELWFKASNDKVVVVAKKRDSIIEAITLFSYIFCSFLFLAAILNFISLFLKAGLNYKNISRLLQWNIRTQIHSTIIFISILSFVIIAIATISFFIKRYELNNRERLSRTMQITVREMEKKLVKQRIFDDQLAIYDSVVNQEVQKLVEEVAEIHNVDVNVYDTTGNLQVTSQPLIYREGFLSKKIHPLAFYSLSRLRQVQYVQNEKLASVSYMSIYSPLRGEDGHAYAYLNIPYFLSQSELKQEISNFLVTIIILNAFIFLIAGVIALFITNRVTRSFSLISEKMKEVSLGKTNEEINWKRDDEIGELVKEYNKMVNKLGESATALARSEREGAWREMARQVAHEIKNPLTPMKLSIQYLQKSIDNNTGNVKELTASVAKTLVEQIDHLSKIAFDFSQFANIGNTNPELLDLKEVIHSLRDLYQVNDNVELMINDIPGKIILYTDKTQMNRLFTNLFQNAIEACTNRERCRINIGISKENGQVRVSVKDNGEGISEDMQSKIFVPNFTTKSSGTGLGLAMCQGIVEHAKGKIWFETEKGEGTTFYVELPLAS